LPFYGTSIINRGSLDLANTILANSTGVDCWNSGTLNATGVNLVEDGSCDPNATTGDPNLGPLANNGGPTLTHALLTGSPAIDAGDNSLCVEQPVNNLDQRGIARPVDGNNDGIADCDIGAYELDPNPDFDACTMTEVLDTFDRANGSLGSDWGGLNRSPFYRISFQRVDAQLGGPAYWNSEVFGPNQAAFVTLSRLDTRSFSQGTLLKVQSGRGPKGRAIAVVYDAVEQAVRVSTLRLGEQSWHSYTKTPVVFADGDKLGGCALDNGEVRVYKNDVQVAMVKLNAADQAYFNDKGGKVGIWSLRAQKAFFDDFGGGTVEP
jgi:hypothetical protein